MNEFLKSKGQEEQTEAKAKSAKAESKPADSSEQKWLDIKLVESQKKVLYVAGQQGKNVYGLTIYYLNLLIQRHNLLFDYRDIIQQLN